MHPFGSPFENLRGDALGHPFEDPGRTAAPDSAPDSAVTYWHLREADGPQVLVLSPAQRQTVQVVHGRLWLTAEGRADDQVLQAGQAVTLCGPGRLRLGALVLASDGPRGARRAGQGRGPTPDGAFAEPGACVLRLTRDVP
ncbi:DUF2917 domain-containing protein [Comamonas serinivorans]|uniref:DUF2917 domain-containing protein n=1 Tax=Comamonas serinivorans TaxID=1082851 RepID=UPI0012F9A33E|nr:DUF2917 domain-containing protein [Comamonas serinivorans]